MTHKHERLTELALIRAIPGMIKGNLKPSRTKNLYERLIKEVDKDLASLPRPTDSEIFEIGKRIEKFGQITGWLNNEKHIGTLLSFCADMLERSNYKHNPKILNILNELIEHLENAGDLKTVCCWAGGIAADKWKRLSYE
jgi:hypothetical protein